MNKDITLKKYRNMARLLGLKETVDILETNKIMHNYSIRTWLLISQILFDLHSQEK